MANLAAAVAKQSDAEAAFWIFFELALHARLQDVEAAKIVGVSRQNWALWKNQKGIPYAKRKARFERATTHVRAAMAERVLPAFSHAARRKFVDALTTHLDAIDAQEAYDAG